jgi:CDP-paratose 2-epimerase
VPDGREGDHICDYSDLRQMQAHYPAWDMSVGLPEILRLIVEARRTRGGYCGS